MVSVSVGEDEVHPLIPRQANCSSGEEASPLRGHPRSSCAAFLLLPPRKCAGVCRRGGVSLVLPLLSQCPPSCMQVLCACVVCVSPSSSSASPLHQSFLFRLPPHSHQTQEHEHPTPTSSPASGSHHGTSPQCLPLWFRHNYAVGCCFVPLTIVLSSPPSVSRPPFVHASTWPLTLPHHALTHRQR